MHAGTVASIISKILEKWLDYGMLHVHLDLKATYQGHWMTWGRASSTLRGQICDSLTHCYGVREAGRTGHKIPSLTHSVWFMGHWLIIKLFDSFAHSKTTQLHTKLGFFAATNFKRTGVKHAVRGISSFAKRNFITTDKNQSDKKPDVSPCIRRI